MHNKFSLRLILLSCLLVIFTAWNILRAFTAITWLTTLNELTAKPSPWLIAGSGLIWAGMGILLIWSIWREKVWTNKFLLSVVASYSVWYWGERFLWQMPRPNWPFAVILNLVLVIFIIFTTKAPSREAYERKS